MLVGQHVSGRTGKRTDADHSPASRVQQRRTALVVHGSRVQGGQAEVGYFQLRVHVEEQVLRLQITVADTWGRAGAGRRVSGCRTWRASAAVGARAAATPSSPHLGYGST